MYNQKKRPQKKSVIVIEFFSITILLILVSLANPPLQSTGDDTLTLFRFLERQQGRNVLGINSEDYVEPCPSEKPVVGWINYSGEKMIYKNLPPDTQASACFTSVQEAQVQGYFEQEN